MINSSNKAKAIFLEAIEQHSPDQWPAFLDEACANDALLRSRVEELLRVQEKLGSFHESANQSIPPTVDDPAVTERPGTVIGPYKLLEQIGEGGFGVVFLAEQTQPVRRKVALKVLKPGMDTRQVVARFEAERQALAIMDHPNIAKVLDAGTTGSEPRTQRSGVSGGDEPQPLTDVRGSGRPYFVMELVKGIPITDYCDQNQIPVRQRLELFVHVCQAVQHAHQKGIIHRDLKPSNVLVTLHDGTPVPKIIDFGISKAMGQQLTDKTLFTNFAQLIGTPMYMSPEQTPLSGLDVDTRSDIYSLGVLLYELLTSTTPFDKDRFKEGGYDEIRRIIREEEPPKPSTRISTLGKTGLASGASNGPGSSGSRSATTPVDQGVDTPRSPSTKLATIATQRKSDPMRLSQLFRGELDWIVMKALEKDRNRRYESANSLAHDVERYLLDEPVQACPPSAWYRLQKAARRNKGGMAIAGLILFFLMLVGSGVGWIVRDRTARQDAIDQKVGVALDDAAKLQNEGKWQEALEAAKRAEGFWADGGSPKLAHRMQELRQDLEMVLRLEEIRLGRGTVVTPCDKDNVWADAAYAKAFREYGIDAEVLEAPEAIERIRARAIQPELTAALDHWAYARKLTRPADDTSWERLVEMVRGADPDEWRNRVRTALVNRKIEALTQLASSPNIRSLPAETLSLLGGALDNSGAPEQAVTVLRQAQQKYPDDFQINFQLAWAQEHSGPPQLDEAIRFYTAARALRPRNVAVHFWLANALQLRGRLDEACAELHRTIDLQPDSAVAHNNLAWLLATSTESKLRNPEEAVSLARKATALAPKQGIYWNTLGVACYRAGSWTEAIAALNKSKNLLQSQFESFNTFFLAMAHWQLGEKEQARQWHEQAVQWMEKNKPDDEELKRFRAESEALLGIKKK